MLSIPGQLMNPVIPLIGISKTRHLRGAAMREAIETYTKLNCGQLRASYEGRKVQLNGWVHRRRDQGALIFIDLRDRWGMTQMVFNRETEPQAHRVAEEARNEY